MIILIVNTDIDNINNNNVIYKGVTNIEIINMFFDNTDNNIAVPRVDNEKMRNVLKVFSEDLTIMRAPLSKKALKFVEAARYGQTRKNVAKCEHRYQCSLPMEIIQQVF